MSKRTFDTSRRQALRFMAAGIASVPLAGLVGSAAALAADMPQVDEASAQAKALKYVHDATKAERVDKGGTPGDQQLCSNCQFIQAAEGAWRPCQLFPGMAVAENGWCMSWMLKMS